MIAGRTAEKAHQIISENNKEVEELRSLMKKLTL